MSGGVSDTYDGIILGAGHNSLILQAYLCKAGLNVLCLERRNVAGGGLTTVEDPRHPGYFHNTHSFYHRALNRMPWYHDLELARQGAIYLEPELNVALLLKSGDTLEWWTDFEKTAESFARFSPKDAKSLRRWRDDFLPIVEKILVPEGNAPPLPSPLRRRLLQRSKEGRLLLKVSELSPLQFVQQEFEHPVIQAGLLFFNGLREVDLRCPGFGHHIAAMLASSGKAQMCVGGSAELASSLVAVVKANGGEILLESTPRRFMVENGRIAGVETESGERIFARHFVASGLNPHQTFLELLDPSHLSKRWRDLALAFKYNEISPLFAINVNLSEPPKYDTSNGNFHHRNPFMVILGLDNIDRYLEIVAHHQEGTIPPTVMWGSCPTVFDPTQAPPGKHTAFMWEKLPYSLKGDPRNWDKERERHGQKMLEVWSDYAPNMREALIDWFASTPLDVERTFPNMKFGDLLIGAFTNGQIGYDRPFPGAGHYRSHIPGLYLCGSSSHPGGNITGLPGYNSAQVILEDLGQPPPWGPSPLEERLRDL